MDDRNRSNSYESLYTQLYDRAELLHESNKRRIRRGLIGLVVLPVVLGIIRNMTDSDKVVFLIIWIIAMFILCAYLMTVEYLDDIIQKTLEDMTDQEAAFDELLIKPDRLQGRLRDKIIDIRAARAALMPELYGTTDNTSDADDPAAVDPDAGEGGAE